MRRLEELPLSLRLICEIHAELMAGTRGQEKNPGEFRRSQNWIGPAGCTLTTARFVPPPPDDMKAALGDLQAFLHDERPLPVLFRVGMAHAQFETIHPFLDGNGRVGRLMITFLLCEREVLKKPLLYLSYYFKKHRAEYYDRLQSIRDSGDWEGWLLFFLEGVAQVANLAAETAQKVLRLREDHRQAIIDNFDRAAAAPLRVLDKLYELPITSPNMVMQDARTSYPTANNIVHQLEKIGILSEVTGQRRNRIYTYRTYMGLFGEL